MRKSIKIILTIVAAVVWFASIVFISEADHSEHITRWLTGISLIILYCVLRAIWGDERLINNKKDNNDNAPQE